MVLTALILSSGTLTGCGKTAENAVSGSQKQEISASDSDMAKDGKKVSEAGSDKKDPDKMPSLAKDDLKTEGDQSSKDKGIKTEAKENSDAAKGTEVKKNTSAEAGSDKDSAGQKKTSSGSQTGNNGTGQLSDKAGQAATAGNSDVKPSGSGQAAKPQNGGSASDAGNSGSAAGSLTAGNKPGSSGSGQAAHTHSWKHQTKTVHHDAETRQEYIIDKQAWDEDIYQDQPVYQSVEKVVCNGCGAEFADYPSFEAHSDYYIDQDDFSHGSWSVGWEQVLVGWTSVKVDTVHHDAEGHYQTVVVRDAYDETVDQGYVCAGCGAVRS